MNENQELELEDDSVVLDMDQFTEESVDEQTDESPIVTQALVDDTDEPVDNGDLMAKATYEEFLERGYITESDDDKFDGSFDWINKNLESLPQRVQQDLIQSVPQEGRDLIEFVLEAGQNLTKDKLVSFYKDYLSDEQSSVETDDEAREFLESVYKTKGMRDKAIAAQLDDLEDENQLLTEAQKELSLQESKVKKHIEEAKQMSAQQIKAQQDWNNSVEQHIQSLPAKQQKIVAETANKARDIVNEVSGKPDAYVELLKFLSYYKNGKFDLSTLEKEVATKTVSGLQNKLAAAKINTGGRGKSDTTKLSEQYELIV